MKLGTLVLVSNLGTCPTRLPDSDWAGRTPRALLYYISQRILYRYGRVTSALQAILNYFNRRRAPTCNDIYLPHCVYLCLQYSKIHENSTAMDVSKLFDVKVNQSTRTCQVNAYIAYMLT